MFGMLRVPKNTYKMKGRPKNPKEAEISFFLVVHSCILAAPGQKMCAGCTEQKLVSINLALKNKTRFEIDH